MTWTILIFFTLFSRIESHNNIIQGSKNHVQPKPSEILDIFRATSKINQLKGLCGQTGSGGARVRTVDVEEFFPRFQTNVKQLEEVFDGSVFDHVAKNLWDYCVKVRSMVSQLKNFNSTDVESIKFDESFDYCVVTYLFNSDRTNGMVDDVLNPIYYLQTLPYVQFSSAEAMKRNIAETMDYVINTMKLYGGDDPGDLRRSAVDEYLPMELTDRLQNIRDRISNLSERFCSLTAAPPIVNVNLILERKILDPSSKFIRSVLNNARISLTYGEFHYKNNEAHYIILNWIVDQTEDSTGNQNVYYTELVTTNPNLLHTELAYPVEKRVSQIWPVDSSPKVIKTLDSPKTLLQSLKTSIGYDRRSYNNAVQYHAVMVDVLMILATKLGYRMLRGMKSVFGDVCLFIFRDKVLDVLFTEDLVNIMRSQLLQFRFYFGKMIDMVKQRLNVILHHDYNAKFYYTFHEESLRILNLIEIKSPVDVFLKKNCPHLEVELDIVDESGVNGRYFDEVKFKRFYFIDTTRYMYEIHDYFSSFINYHLSLKIDL